MKPRRVWRNRSANRAALAAGILLVVSSLALTVHAQTPAAGRILDCIPETTTAGRGTSRSITCTVTDASGHPVPGVDVTFTEVGPAAITSVGTTPAPDNDAPDGHEYRTNSEGRVIIVVSTVAGDSLGTSTVTGRISGGAPGAPWATTECMRQADDPSGAPAGVCEDSVTVTWATDTPPPRACHDGIDNDGDGYLDYPSDTACESFEGVGEMTDDHGYFATNITIHYRQRLRLWEGEVGAPHVRCQRGRAVRLKRALRGYRDPVVGEDISSDAGEWRITTGNRPGRYYVTTPDKYFTNTTGDTVRCARDRSITVRID